jgi:hypothetical protein
MSLNKLSISSIKKKKCLRYYKIHFCYFQELLMLVKELRLNVRGGGADQNLILLDETTIFNSSYVFQFFSPF